MDTQVIEKKFESMGARVKFSEPAVRDGNLSIDIRRDKEGEYFDLRVKKEIEMLVLDVQKADRHLLLMARDPDNPKAKFLCGHDERHWFTCAIPEGKVTSVIQAKQALKPKELQNLEAREGLKTKRAHKRHRRLNSGIKVHRQGEFMFIPHKDFQPSKGFSTVVLKNEPMQRGGGNAHMAQFLYRRGGTTVWVSAYSPEARNGLTQRQYDSIRKRDPESGRYNWRTMVRDPEVFVKGHITHVEHKTLDLGDVWHKVVLNTENQARAARNVAFLD